MTRRIFIGSSSEGLQEANRLKEVLEDVNHGIECELWPETFDPGSLTFQALEDMLHRNCGAVFVAKPEDSTNIRGEEVKVPRANVMLEFGLVAGRLGRHNIALCRYEGARLPSDLTGMTAINMDHPAPPSDWNAEQKNQFREQAESRLKDWSRNLLATAENVPRMVLMHGYTGRWSFELQLERWRGIDIHGNSYAQVNGWIDLFVSPDGTAGAGFAHGRLSFSIEAVGDHKAYSGEIRIAHKLTDLYCDEKGKLEFTSVVYSLQAWRRDGTARPELEGVGSEKAPEPWTFAWQLQPSPGLRRMNGTLKSVLGRTEGRVEVVKTSASAAAAAGA